jgi:hypothetical protein
LGEEGGEEVRCVEIEGWFLNEILGSFGYILEQFRAIKRLISEQEPNEAM